MITFLLILIAAAVILGPEFALGILGIIWGLIVLAFYLALAALACFALYYVYVELLA